MKQFMAQDKDKRTCVSLYSVPSITPLLVYFMLSGMCLAVCESHLHYSSCVKLSISPYAFSLQGEKNKTMFEIDKHDSLEGRRYTYMHASRTIYGRTQTETLTFPPVGPHLSSCQPSSSGYLVLTFGFSNAKHTLTH